MKNKTRLVVTGMGLVGPGGNNVADFWESIIQGKSGIGHITKFETTNLKCKIGGEVRNFDPVSYGMSTKEAKRLDPFTQYAVAAADMAIKDSGLIFDNQNENVSILLGVGIGGFQTFENAGIALQNNDIVSALSIPMLMPNAAAAEISIRHKIHGPAFSINAACASALYAIIQSSIMIQVGLTDVVITGGSEAAMSPLSYTAFTNMKALTTSGNNSPETASKPFNPLRDGFVMGEGAGILVIESLEHALNRGAKILAEIIGFGMCSDAYHITSPGNGAYSAMQYALHSAGIEPYQIDYINAHGTSTEQNDAKESNAIEQIFGTEMKVSSTKSMTGHLLGAAAAIETIICIKTIQDGIIPPTINYGDFDPNCGNLDYIVNKARKEAVYRVMNNSFGFGGHNASVIVQGYQN